MRAKDWFWLGVGAVVLLAIAASEKDSPGSSSMDDDLQSSYPPSEDAMNYVLPGSYESSPRR